jgi:hypothetical protein
MRPPVRPSEALLAEEEEIEREIGRAAKEKAVPDKTLTQIGRISTAL